jgi:FAD/FMN-containing dehydrogenase
MTAVTEVGNDVRVNGAAPWPVDALRARLSGAVFQPGDEGYGEARTIWNAMIDKQPAAIALVENAQDVAEAVSFAREQGIELSIRGCGHNIAGTALSDGGLTISFARMREVQVDPATRRVRVQPGADWGAVDRATEPHGLVVPGGIVSTTGVAGFTLGGGFGWLTRKWGYTSDRLLSASVVTAGGRTVTASEQSEPDLFWAIRGGGGNFGIVTEFEFEAIPLGPEVAAGIIFWPIDMAAEVIDHFRAVTASAPLELTHVLAIRVAPPAPFLPESIHGKPVIGIAAMYGGTVEEGIEAMGPVRSLGGSVADTIKPKPYREHQAFLDAGQPYGRRYYWKSIYMSDVADGMRDALLANGTTFSSPFSSVLLPHLDGVAKGEAGSSAVSNREAAYLLNFQASWENPAEDETHIAWARKNFDAVRPYATGQYVNFLTQEEVDDPGRQSYQGAALQRLAELKRRYDPQNLFRVNKNITPA